MTASNEFYGLTDPDDWDNLVYRFEQDQAAAAREHGEPAADPDVLQAEANARALRSARASEYAKQVLAAERAANKASSVDRIVDGSDFLFGDDSTEATVWGSVDTPIWASGESLMIFGPPGLGKSTLSHLLVFARLGLIPSVLNMPVHDDGGNVFYIAADRPKQIRRAMKRLALPEHLDTLKKRLIVHRGPLPVDICQTKNWLADEAERHGATTVVIDSIKDVCSKPSGDDEANGYNTARQELIARNIELIENHHNRKAGGDNRAPNTVDDVFGSRWLTGGAGSILCLWGQPGDTVAKFIHLRGPGELHLPMDVLLDKERGQITPYDHLDLDDLVRMAGINGITVQELAGRLNGTEEPSKSQIESVRTRLKRHPDKYHAMDTGRFRMTR